MSKEIMYRQCTCEKVLGTSKMTRVFWTDETKAIVGKNVKIEEDNGDWSEGWTVASVSNQSVNQKYVNQMKHAHTKQRKASDI